MEQKDTEGQFITSTNEILRLFRHVQEKLSPVTITFPGMAKKLTTYVVNVDNDSRQLLFDEVLPLTDSPLMQDGRPFNLETYYDGCRIRARNIKAIPRKDSEGSYSYLVVAPDEVHYYQRRAAFRAQVRRTLNIWAHLLDDGGKVVRAKLRDLSAEGCKLEIDGNYQHVLERYKEAQPIKFTFPNGTNMTPKVIMRHVVYDEARKMTQCGCQLGELTPGEESQVANVVNELQRDHINFVRNGGNPEGVPALFLPPTQDSARAALESKLEALENKPEPPAPTAAEVKKSEQAKAKAVRARQSGPIDYRVAHQAGVSAVRSLVAKLRAEQELPISQAMEAAEDLSVAWETDRQPLLMLTRIRNGQDFLFEHSVSVGLQLADQVVRSQQKDDSELVRKLIFAGMVHDLAKSLLPDGVQETRVKLPPDRNALLQKHAQKVRSILATMPNVPKEAVMVATQNFERLNGSGIPDGLRADEIHPLGKMAAVIDVLDMLANRVGRDVYYHPVLAFKAMLNLPQELDSDSVKKVIRYQGLYPLGATVKLSNGYIGLVMRHNDDSKPTHARLVYNLADQSHFPPRDIELASSGVTVEAPADPVKLGLSNSLLRLPLQN
ncbi:HD domain-containing phosphohydrolase [Salinispirillum marinum]|uniref:HD domain-containing phosphohydrolase n=2 Tax=Saccharospirillaceae TaxID=255527 RepID=A0ABV8BB07_9GAMM